MRALLLVAFVVVLSACAAAASDWPHIRGPNHDAASPEKGIVEKWPSTGPPVLWSRELGAGYSGFVVAGTRAITLFQTRSGIFLVALDADTGAELWRQHLDLPWQPGGMYPGPYASPTWYEGRIYYATPFGKVGCVRETDGQEIWSVNVRTKFQGRGTEFGFASTPLVEDGRVFLPVGGSGAAMAALAAADGSTLWTSGDEPASYCPAYPITLDGRRLVVGFLRNSLVIHDPETGLRLWRERLSHDYDEHAAWPLFDGRNLLIASPFRLGSRVFELTQSGKEIVGRPRWNHKLLSNDVCSSLLRDGLIYGFDLQQSQASTHRPSRGSFKCLEVSTGKLLWETDLVGQATPLYADRKLILWSETGALVLARPRSDRYEELARAQILSGGRMCWAAPALAGKRLFLRDHQHVVCLYLGDPSELDASRPLATRLTHEKSISWARLVPHEPEFPNDAPAVNEIALWFVVCSGLLLFAACASKLGSRWFSRWNRGATFFLVAFLLGCVGTTAIGAWGDTFVLTWPLGLFVAFRAVVKLAFHHETNGWRRQVLPRVALIFFVLLCYGYYLLCLATGLALAWSFLIGIAPAAPFVIVAARSRRPRVRIACEIVAFVIYFWVSALIPGWKSALVE